MRIRNVKNKEEILNKSSYLIKDPESLCGKYKDLFKNNNPIHLEIGMGKGKFIIENAMKNPSINFIGLEKADSIVVRALEKLDDLNLDNLYIIKGNALDIDKIFKGEISLIYLNFSDPWPKARHHLRRLTSKTFLDKYDFVFKEKANIEMRTDNDDLFSYSLSSLSINGYTLEEVSLDFHKELDETVITTEYEDKFSNEGIKIKSLVATKTLSNKDK